MRKTIQIGPKSSETGIYKTDLESAAFRIGDRLRIGEVLLEVTAPRFPCPKLAKRMADPTFVKQFRHAIRGGYPPPRPPRRYPRR
jgi:MOSC domain-containing protein YiiM